MKGDGREGGREGGLAIPIDETKESKHYGECVRLELPLRRKRSARSDPQWDQRCQMHPCHFNRLF
jgi:hypothetical protein